MKRITYISHPSPDLSGADIQAIAEVSARNNRELGVSGVLISAAGIFFQIIEGEETILDRLYRRIASDARHSDVICLQTEHDISQRLFPDWSMRTINLDEDYGAVSRAFKSLLQRLGEAYRIINKYTPPAVSGFLDAGLNPLEIPPQRREKIILFADIVAFSTLTENLPVEQVAELVNRYLNLCTQVISQHQGEVTKYIGDCVMAYFGPGQADNALRASLEILRQLQALRASAPPASALGVLYSGIGLAAGSVMEGNFGASLKVDYTVIGDAVNTASRLEALTRHAGHPLLFSAEVKALCQENQAFVEAGRYRLKGKAGEVSVFSLDHPLTTREQGRLGRERLQAYLES